MASKLPYLVSLAFLVLFAAQPAQSHGEGGIPAMLDHIDVEAHAHDNVNTIAHNGLFADHDVQDAAHAGLAGDHIAQSIAIAGLAADHDAHDIAHAALAADVDAIQARLEFFDVDVETAAASVAGLPPAPPNEALALVHVSYGGAGVTGLPESAFVLATRVVPAGECALEIDSVTEYSGGDYVLELTPIDEPAQCDWAAGDYLSSLTITSGARVGSAVLKVSVPAASTSSPEDAIASTQSSTSLLRTP